MLAFLLAATIVVSPGGSIQSAIDVAAPGDTILVQPGTYAEELSIGGSGFILRGDRAILDGGGTLQTALLVRGAHDVIVDGFDIRAFTQDGISLGEESANVTIRNCFIHDLTGDGDAIRIDRVTGFVIADTRMSRVAQGLDIQNASRGTIVRTTASDTFGFLIDGEMTEGDGFSIGLPEDGFVATDLLFEDCVAERNNEDGFDTFKAIRVVLRRCRALRNGLTQTRAGEGVGIKAGTSHRIENCISAFNRADGFNFSDQADTPRDSSSIVNSVSVANGEWGITVEGTGALIATITNSIAAGNSASFPQDYRAQIGTRRPESSPSLPRLGEDFNIVFGDGLIFLDADSAEGRHVSAIGLATIAADPRLGDDFAPLPGSPAIDSATTAPAFDINCHARIGIADRGAIEFGSAAGSACGRQRRHAAGY